MVETKTRVTPTGLTHLALRVRDVPRAVDFYTNVLGLTVKNQSPRGAFLTARGVTSHDLALFALGDDAPGPEPNRVGMYHMAWAMESFEDLQAMYDHLVESGANICGFGNSQTSTSIHLFDPDGNEIEMIYELPLDQWPAERTPGAKFPHQLKRHEMHSYL
jgi:catechol-2,3-dioxygenase